MQRLRAVLTFVLWEFGPLIALLRSVIGSVSLGLMVAFSVTQGRRLFFFCRWLGLLPAVQATPPDQHDV